MGQLWLAAVARWLGVWRLDVTQIVCGGREKSLLHHRNQLRYHIHQTMHTRLLKIARVLGVLEMPAVLVDTPKINLEPTLAAKWLKTTRLGFQVALPNVLNEQWLANLLGKNHQPRPIPNLMSSVATSGQFDVPLACFLLLASNGQWCKSTQAHPISVGLGYFCLTMF